MSCDLKDFHVISVISNPVRYKSRYNIYRQFQDMMKHTGVHFHTVELAFGDREHCVTESGNPYHLQLRTQDELWHKENLLNLGIQHAIRFNKNAKYFAWVDADVFPMMPPRMWFEETWHALQHWHVVQMFEHAYDLDPNFNITGPVQNGFMWSYFKNDFRPPPNRNHGPYGHWHPGFAWACTREALDHLGGLIDFAILGAADTHMALALIHVVENSFASGISQSYKDKLLAWQERCKEFVKKDVGFVKGSIYHYWHGRKKDRRYHDRWMILVNNKYCPHSDIKLDSQGLLQLTNRNLLLRDQIRAYMSSRSEDSIDL